MTPTKTAECRKIRRMTINPEYSNAQYEYRAVTRHGKIVALPWPIRGNEIKDGDIVPVPPIIIQKEDGE